MKVIAENVRTTTKGATEKKAKSYKKSVQKVANKYAHDLKKNSTECEKIVEKFLKENKFYFEAQKPVFLIDRFYILDFLIKTKNGTQYALEVDGSWHHSLHQRNKDKERDTLLKKHLQIKTIRITNEEVLASPTLILSKILQACPKFDTQKPNRSKIIKVEPKPKKVKVRITARYRKVAERKARLAGKCKTINFTSPIPTYTIE